MDDKKQDEQPDPSMAGFRGSTNEPSADKPKATDDKSKAPEDNGNGDDDKLPSKTELEDMTRAELDALSESRGVDTAGAHTKADVIDALQKDARKRRRAAKED